MGHYKNRGLIRRSGKRGSRILSMDDKRNIPPMKIEPLDDDGGYGLIKAIMSTIFRRR